MILEQIRNGITIRMAVLAMIADNRGPRIPQQPGTKGITWPADTDSVTTRGGAPTTAGVVSATTVFIMTIAILATILVVLVFANIVVKARQRRRQHEPGNPDDAYPYRLTGHFLTPAERFFFSVLQQAIGEHGFIFPKPHIADVLKPESGLSPSQNATAFNKIKAKHFDFLICDPRYLQPAVAIELDDASQKREARAEPDTFMNQAAAAAGLSLLRITASPNYAIAALRAQLAPYLGIATEAESMSIPKAKPEPEREAANASKPENKNGTDAGSGAKTENQVETKAKTKTGAELESGVRH